MMMTDNRLTKYNSKHGKSTRKKEQSRGEVFYDVPWDSLGFYDPANRTTHLIARQRVKFRYQPRRAHNIISGAKGVVSGGTLNFILRASISSHEKVTNHPCLREILITRERTCEVLGLGKLGAPQSVKMRKNYFCHTLWWWSGAAVNVVDDEKKKSQRNQNESFNISLELNS